MREQVLKILPPVWFLIFLAAGLVLDALFPSMYFFVFPYPVLGLILFVVALVLVFSARSMFKKENTEILPTSPTNSALITQGPFRYTRNPMYLGMVLGLLGIGLYLSSFPLYLAALAQFLVLNFVFIPFEEEKMSRQFGDTYTAYTKKVRRWF